MTLRLGGDGAITGCTSLEEPTLSVSGLLVTTPIVATSGTVAAPSYTFTGDTNTGFYQPNGDAIGVSLAGVERAILDSSSNNSWLLIKSTASTGDSAELFLGNSYSEGSISYSHGTGNTNRNLMFKTAGTEKMRLDSYGNLGLGVSPNNVNNFKTFTLNGTTGGNIEFQDQGTLIGSIYNLADQFIIQGQGSTIPVAFRTNSTERMRIAADGNVGIGKSNPNTTFEIYEDTNPYIYLQNSTTGTSATDGFSIIEFGLDTYINNREAGNMIFFNNGSERMRIDSLGNINIGAKHFQSNASTVDALQIGYGLNLYEDSYSSGNQNYVVLAHNIAYNSGGNRYMRSEAASRVMQYGGNISFQNAGAGTAGNTVSLTERMKIDSSGSIDFLGAVASGYTTGALIFSGGRIASYVSNSTTGSDPRLYVYNGTTTSYPARINADGSAVFRGIVDVGPSTIASTSAKNVRIGDTGYIQARRSGSEGVFYGYNLNSTQATSLITASGNAAFAGSVSIGGTAAANTIDEYEEGSCTITLYVTGTSNTNAATNTVAYYTKVGNIVNVTYYSALLSLTNGGNAEINGLPFVAKNVSQHYPVAVFTHSNAFTTDIQNGYMGTNSTNLYPMQVTSTTPAVWNTSGGARYLMFTITYQTN